MEWFGSASSIEELKGEYLNLLKKWKNDADLMAEINAQYEDLLASFGEELNKKIDEENKELAPEKQKKHYEVDKDKFAEVLAKVVDFNSHNKIADVRRKWGCEVVKDKEEA
jgi:hypothetical protein